MYLAWVIKLRVPIFSFLSLKQKALLISIFSLSITAMAQDNQRYKIRIVAFYNVENLFDTIRDTLVYDGDRTPDGKDHWTPVRYASKIAAISKTLSQIGAGITGSSPDLIGLCEVENRQVLEDLTNHSGLRSKNYGIIHFESPDERGIDVALLYKKDSFLPVAFTSRRLLLWNSDNERDYTRDQLVVQGLLDSEEIFVIINHWPSRSGGEARSRPFRIAAARLNNRIMDSLRRSHPSPKVIIMGDFNDNPTDFSIRKTLQIKGSKDSLLATDLFNPMERLFKKGVGSLAYRDQWSLFDQIFFTGNFMNDSNNGYRYWKAGVFRPSYLITPTGMYRGYPFRTYANGNYTGGYSDHFPVYAFLLKAEPLPSKRKPGPGK